MRVRQDRLSSQGLRLGRNRQLVRPVQHPRRPRRRFQVDHGCAGRQQHAHRHIRHHRRSGDAGLLGTVDQKQAAVLVRQIGRHIRVHLQLQAGACMLGPLRRRLHGDCAKSPGQAKVAQITRQAVTFLRCQHLHADQRIAGQTVQRILRLQRKATGINGEQPTILQLLKVQARRARCHPLPRSPGRPEIRSTWQPLATRPARATRSPMMSCTFHAFVPLLRHC